MAWDQIAKKSYICDWKEVSDKQNCWNNPQKWAKSWRSRLTKKFADRQSQKENLSKASPDPPLVQRLNGDPLANAKTYPMQLARPSQETPKNVRRKVKPSPPSFHSTIYHYLLAFQIPSLAYSNYKDDKTQQIHFSLLHHLLVDRPYRCGPILRLLPKSTNRLLRPQGELLQSQDRIILLLSRTLWYWCWILFHPFS